MPPLMKERSYRWLLWSLALLGLSLDQASKYVVFKQLYVPGQQDGQREIIPGVFRLYVNFTDESDRSSFLSTLRTWSAPKLPHVNQGALFSLGIEYANVANVFFATVSSLAVLVIGYISTRSGTARDGWLCAALGLVLAGALGNLYDRVVFEGVRDFLHFYLIKWPVFNIADSSLVCGAAILLVHASWKRPASGQEVRP